MGVTHFLGGLFDPEGQAAADNAAARVGQVIGSQGYKDASQLSGDEAVQQGAAALANSNIGVNTANLDQDTDAYARLQAIYAAIAAQGGQVSAAAQKQAAADLANTSANKLVTADRAEAANVLGIDNQERAQAAAGANKSRAQQLATQLQKQVWNTAISHANFEAQLAGKGLQNQDANAAFDLANSMSTSAQNANNNAQTLAREQALTDYQNTAFAIQGIGGALSQGAGTLGSMSSGPSLTPSATYSTGATYSPTSGAVLGSQANLGTSTAKYVNPVTGNTVNSNLPDESAWGDWLTSGSNLASV